VFGSLIGIKRKSELLDVAQSLKLRRVDQVDQQPIIRLVVGKADDVVDRVTI
jgi:hypothetical protein